MKKFVAILAAMMFAILAIVPMASASTAVTNTQLYVYSDNGHGVNLRAKPTTESAVLARLGEGKVVTVRSFASDEWTAVTVHVDGKDIRGYIMNKYLSDMDPVNMEQTFTKVNSFKVTVTPSNGASGHVNLRAKASIQSTCLAYLRKGETLTVTAESQAWYKVRDTHGHTGYVVKAFVAK